MMRKDALEGPARFARLDDSSIGIVVGGGTESFPFRESFADRVGTE